MVELLIGASELVLGFALGFGWARIGGRPFVVATAVGIAVCVGIVLRAATSADLWCSPGEDCEPTTRANWLFLGVGVVGLWVLAVAMGYGVAARSAFGGRAGR